MNRRVQAIITFTLAAAVEGRFPAPEGALAAIAVVLVRQGLTVDVAVGTLDYEPRYAIAAFGERLMRSLRR